MGTNQESEHSEKMEDDAFENDELDEKHHDISETALKASVYRGCEVNQKFSNNSGYNKRY